MLNVRAMRTSWVGIKEMLMASRKDNDRLRTENARLLRWNHLLRDSLKQVAKHGHAAGCESCAQALSAVDGQHG